MSRRATVLVLLGIVVVTLNLRPAIVAVSPLLDELRDDTGLSSAGASLLTTLPIFCFGALAPLAPRLTRRFGSEAVVAGAMLVLAAGILVRLVPGIAPLLLGTVVVGGAIAVTNVLIPSVVKRDLAHIAGPAMGVYSMTLTAGAALAAGVTVPLEDAVGTDWRGALGLWAVLPLVALVAWAPVLRLARRGGARVAHPGVGGLWRDRTAWAVSLYMGLGSLQFYTATAWIPTLLGDDGVSDARAGLLLSYMNVVGAIAAFVVPILAGRLRRQSGLAATLIGLWALTWGGILLDASGGAWLWMTLMGVAQGGGVALALTLTVLRSPDAPHAVEMSGMAQTVGYLVSAIGPIAVGALHDATGGWTVPVIVLLVFLVPMLGAGVLAGRRRFVRGAAVPAEAPA
ncbi:CynX/NimT family MFS transporter, partial [Patulibacter sp. S7RM1-6]